MPFKAWHFGHALDQVVFEGSLAWMATAMPASQLDYVGVMHWAQTLGAVPYCGSSSAHLTPATFSRGQGRYVKATCITCARAHVAQSFTDFTQP